MPIHFPIWTCEYLPLLIAPGVNRFMRQAELLITPDMCRRGDPTARSPGADDSARFRERRCDLGPGLNSHGTIQIERDMTARPGEAGSAHVLPHLAACGRHCRRQVCRSRPEPDNGDELWLHLESADFVHCHAPGAGARLAARSTKRTRPHP